MSEDDVLAAVREVLRPRVSGYFPNLIRGTLPLNHPRMWLGRCRRLEVQSEAPLRIHLDGEFFAQPEDRLTAASVELLPARLRVEHAAGTAASR